MILHITNGDSAADTLAKLFPHDTILSWNDVLHDGPVPPGLNLDQLSEVRARFIADCGWAPYEKALADFRRRDSLLARYAEFSETVLWFEHDLYDQLQLIQILDLFRDQLKLGHDLNLSLVQASDYLGSMPLHKVGELFPGRQTVTREQLELAADAWHAFRADDPRGLESFLEQDEALPYLGAALERYCEEFPWIDDGLTRTQRTIRLLQSAGITDPRQLFRAVTQTEDPIWMGDSSFFLVLEGRLPPERKWLWDSTRRRFSPRPS